MSDDNVKMFYVAADPTQPGAAWALCLDDPRWKKETAKDIAAWIRQGATVMHVTPDVAREIITKWVLPEKKAKRKSTKAMNEI